MSEMVHVLKPNGRFYCIIAIFEAAEIKELMSQSGLTEITRVNCWTSGFPMVLLYGKKLSKGIVENNILLNSKLATSAAAENYKVGRDSGSAIITSINTDHGVNIDLGESDHLLRSGVAVPTPSYTALRNLLMAGFMVFLVLFLVATVYLWPSLDVPKAIKDNNRLTSGYLAPFARPFLMLWLQIYMILKEYSCERNVSAKSITLHFFKYTFGGLAISAVISLIGWLPSMLIDLWMVKENINPKIAGIINIVVVVVIAFVIVRVVRRLAQKRT